MQTTKSNKTTATNISVLLSAICEVGNTLSGELIGRDAAFISRLKSGEKSITLEEFCALTAGIGIELAPKAEHQVTIDRQLYDSLMHLSRLGLDHINQFHTVSHEK